MTTKRKKSTRRKTLGQSPLDTILSPPIRPRASSSTVHIDQPDASPQRKIRATFHLPSDLIEECRNAAVWLAGPPERLTMARLAEDALRRELDRLRAEHTQGEPFPQREGNLKGGRPIGS